MSDKLQEIKDLHMNALVSGQKNILLDVHYLPYVIEQLEQAQAENQRLKEIDQQGIKCQMEYARQNKLLKEENERLNRALDRIGSYCVTDLPQVSDFVLKVKRGEDF